MSAELAEMKKKYDALVNAVRDIDAKAQPGGIAFLRRPTPEDPQDGE